VASGNGGSVSTREQRTILWGIGVVLIAVVIVRGLLPFMRDWQTREARLATVVARTAQLQGLAAQAPQLAQAATIAERELAGAPRRVLHARTAALAASTLQSLLQEASDGAGMAVNRVDASPESDESVTATLSVVGDIHGLAALLATLERGPRVVRVERLLVTQNTALRGAPDVLQVTLGVRAPVVLE
jgi:type II secretory pathway component PulM